PLPPRYRGGRWRVVPPRAAGAVRSRHGRGRDARGPRGRRATRAQQLQARGGPWRQAVDETIARSELLRDVGPTVPCDAIGRLPGGLLRARRNRPLAPGAGRWRAGTDAVSRGRGGETDTLSADAPLGGADRRPARHAGRGKAWAQAARLRHRAGKRPAAR